MALCFVCKKPANYQCSIECEVTFCDRSCAVISRHQHNANRQSEVLSMPIGSPQHVRFKRDRSIVITGKLVTSPEELITKAIQLITPAKLDLIKILATGVVLTERDDFGNVTMDKTLFDEIPENATLFIQEIDKLPAKTKSTGRQPASPPRTPVTPLVNPGSEPFVFPSLPDIPVPREEPPQPKGKGRGRPAGSRNQPKGDNLSEEPKPVPAKKTKQGKLKPSEEVEQVPEEIDNLTRWLADKKDVASIEGVKEGPFLFDVLTKTKDAADRITGAGSRFLSIMTDELEAAFIIEHERSKKDGTGIYLTVNKSDAKAMIDMPTEWMMVTKINAIGTPQFVRTGRNNKIEAFRPATKVGDGKEHKGYPTMEELQKKRIPNYSEDEVFEQLFGHDFDEPDGKIPYTVTSMAGKPVLDNNGNWTDASALHPPRIFKKTVGGMNSNVLFLVSSNPQFATFHGSLDWTAVHMLQESGRKVAIGIMVTEKAESQRLQNIDNGVYPPTGFAGIQKLPNIQLLYVKTKHLDSGKAVYVLRGFDDDDHEVNYKAMNQDSIQQLWYQLGAYDHKPRHVIPAVVDPLQSHLLTEMLDKNGQIVRLRTFSNKSYTEKRNFRSRTVFVGISDEQQKHLDTLTNSLHTAQQALIIDGSTFMAPHPHWTQFKSELIPIEQRNSEAWNEVEHELKDLMSLYEKAQSKEHWNDLARAFKTLVHSDDNEVLQAYGWIWFLSRLLSYQSVVKGGSWRFQTKTDFRIVAFLRALKKVEVQIPKSGGKVGKGKPKMVFVQWFPEKEYWKAQDETFLPLIEAPLTNFGVLPEVSKDILDELLTIPNEMWAEEKRKAETWTYWRENSYKLNFQFDPTGTTLKRKVLVKKWEIDLPQEMGNNFFH